MTTEVAEIVHSGWGPSSAHRWINCIGSVPLIEKLVEELGPSVTEAGEAADEGSAAHSLLATCLLTGDQPWEHEGETITIERSGRKFVVDTEMMDGVQMAIDFVEEKMEQYADKIPILLVEQRVHSKANPHAFGTADIIILIPGERIIVPDFKYGRIPVEPDGEQVRLYGHYVFETWPVYRSVYSEDDCAKLNPEAAQAGVDFNKLELFPDPNTVAELYIIQPRTAGHPKGPKRRHVTTKAELARFFYGEALPAMQSGQEEGAHLCMGSWCTYCPAAKVARCPALQRGVEEMEIGAEPKAISDDDLGKLLDKLDLVAGYDKLVRKEAFERMKNGHIVPGRKLVQMKGNRVWKPEAGPLLVQIYGNDAFSEPVLKSPPQIEALKKGELSITDDAGNVVDTLKGAKKIVARLAMKPETGITMARADDAREEVKSQMDAMDKAMGVTDG